MLLQGDDQKVGTIPDLLKHYVWKKPKTLLDALREIIRALPVAVGAVEWRTGVSEVVTTTQLKSTSVELSTEARTLLIEAVTNGGRIHHLRYIGGEEISAGRKSILPNQDPRTIARWIGGLEDLQRRRYVKDLGHKREVFEVTREGYEAADTLAKANEVT